MAKPTREDPAGIVERIETFLAKPYWVIDVLPAQVPAHAQGQFFAVEDWLLTGKRGNDLRLRFADMLLKLNCYHDLLVYHSEGEKVTRNPKPKKLERWVVRNKRDLSIILAPEEALIQVHRDSTHMTLYNASPELVKEVGLIASASGLFVWQPPQDVTK